MPGIKSLEEFATLVDVAVRLAVVAVAKMSTKDEIEALYSYLEAELSKNPATTTGSQEILASCRAATLELREALEGEGVERDDRP
jgi:hypothetical protein